jgi:hypothetical protein
MREPRPRARITARLVRWVRDGDGVMMTLEILVAGPT